MRGAARIGNRQARAESLRLMLHFFVLFFVLHNEPCRLVAEVSLGDYRDQMRYDAKFFGLEVLGEWSGIACYPHRC